MFSILDSTNAQRCGHSDIDSDYGVGGHDYQGENWHRDTKARHTGCVGADESAEARQMVRLASWQQPFRRE